MAGREEIWIGSDLGGGGGGGGGGGRGREEEEEREERSGYDDVECGFVIFGIGNWNGGGEGVLCWR